MNVEASVRRDVGHLLQGDPELADSLLNGYIYLATHQGLWTLRIWLKEIKEILEVKIKNTKVRNVDFFSRVSGRILRDPVGGRPIS